jgi:phosphatidylserine decarboxylase
LKIAKEGFPFIVGSALLTAAVCVFSFGRAGWNWAAAVPFVVLLFMFYFFRDPERETPQVEGAIISPADGRVILIKELREEEFLKADARMVSIFMSPFNVHVNRAPYGGRVEAVKHTAGSFKAASAADAWKVNENIAMHLSSDRGQLLVRQVAGFIARRAVCRVIPGDVLKTGQRYGIIKFSSRLDVYLPPEAKLEVKVGDRVQAGRSIIARW